VRAGTKIIESYRLYTIYNVYATLFAIDADPEIAIACFSMVYFSGNTKPTK